MVWSSTSVDALNPSRTARVSLVIELNRYSSNYRFNRISIRVVTSEITQQRDHLLPDAQHQRRHLALSLLKIT